MFNFLGLLGWSLDDKTEILSREELVRYFSLERISPTAAIFNIEKLNWMNGVYIRKLTPDEFYEAAKPFLGADKDANKYIDADREYVKKVLPLVQDRTRTLIEVPELTRFFFVEELDYDAKLLIEKEMLPAAIRNTLEISLKRLKALPVFNAESLEKLLRPLAEELGLKTSQLFGMLRTATTGRIAAPPLFQTMEVLGKERSLNRIQEAIKKL
jgi:glutamyl-tRNA synthetase